MAMLCSYEQLHYLRELEVCQVMEDAKLYPLTFVPALRDYVWGGRRLETLYGRALPPGIVAESWEISGYSSVPTYADSGSWAGWALPAILSELGERLVGTHGAWALARSRFPLLVKLLDANADLSVQVHPGDAYAQVHERGELGKTEMWYILHADPGTRLILGLKRGTTRDSFRQALASGRVEETLNYVQIRAGEAISVPTGTVHALLAGTVVTEIQQNSDLTYRVYDWNRLGVDGRPRQLHVEKALDVIDFSVPAPGVSVPKVVEDSGALRRLELERNRYFVVEKVELSSAHAYRGICDGSTLEIWGCIAGNAVVASGDAVVGLPAIRYALLPAALGEFVVTATERSVCLRVFLPPATT
jgi:mannose-6-phosphate isomerase